MNFDELVLANRGPGDSNDDSSAMRIGIIPQKCGLLYFEVIIINGGSNGIIGIGFCGNVVNKYKVPGSENTSWGYYGSNGETYCCLEYGRPYGPSFTTGDIIGCCLNFKYNTVFYTKNGVHQGIAFRNIEGVLNSCVWLKSQHATVKINFGHEKFKYAAINNDDIDDELLKKNWIKIFNQSSDELTKPIEIEPNNTVALGYRGKAYFVMGKYNEALADFTKVLEAEPNNMIALRYRGETYHMMGHFRESLADFINLLEIKPDDAWTLKAHEGVARDFLQEWEDFDVDIWEWWWDAWPDVNPEQWWNSSQDREDALIGRSPGNGKCATCNQYNTTPRWCRTCDPKLATQGWTSGVERIDDLIKEFQLEAPTYSKLIEWIPFDSLKDIKMVGKGGFSSVYSAIWLDGVRKIKGKYGNYERSRDKSCIVALKNLYGFETDNFLKEFRNNVKCRLIGSTLNIYGLTRNEENEYFMVLQYADKGNLHKFLATDFKKLNWRSKLQQLTFISYDLDYIHKAGYIHGDFHSGNILQTQHKGGIQSYVADLGLSKGMDELNVENATFGVLPYVAPEVLNGQPYTSASDIYGLGIMMTEMTTGKRAYDGYPFDHNLALMICDKKNPLRPGFAIGTPDFYVKLAKQCMDPNPKKRPTAKDVGLKLYQWQTILMKPVVFDEELDIQEKFMAADKIIETLNVAEQKHPTSMYTSKIINTKQIADSLINTDRDSTQIDFAIPDEINEPRPIKLKYLVNALFYWR